MALFKVLATATALTAALPAYAATVVNFDTLPGGGAIADGTAMGTQFAALGVTFAASNGGVAGSPIATTYSGGPPDMFYSGNYLANIAAPSLVATRYDLMQILFTTPVSGVSFSLNTFYTMGQATFKAYDAAGALLQNVTLSANGGWDRRTLSASGISRIDMTTTTFANGARAIYGLDQLTFTADPVAAVPEPASWAMLIGGFALAGGALRRRPVRTIVTFAG